MLEGLAVEKALLMLDLLSELASSPGAGMAGSFRLRFIATCDLLRSEARLSRRGEPLLLLTLRSAAFIVAAAVRECVEARGDGDVSWCDVEWFIVIGIVRGWLELGPDEDGNEFMSGGILCFLI